MQYKHITRRLRGILNAWHFQFDSALVYTAQWFRLGGWRCSPLNAALNGSRTINFG
ncbi:acetyltransferase [Vibrio parahaemolyticus]|nr:acetyltransferase [Vibrio parahaemolyticus]EGR0997791.1 acetyltransferase [Vibrio parahaemolyticus]EGR3441899.1 acetyltransferase [Vibrio parahaemolyticus]MQC42567.1 acetyltransferase [Vibrio parahaemolyticus]MQC67767.1 acetyltransferase [Vibrio parahaemolyticus]